MRYESPEDMHRRHIEAFLKRNKWPKDDFEEVKSSNKGRKPKPALGRAKLDKSNPRNKNYFKFEDDADI